MQAIDHAAVRETVVTRGSVDTGNPQCAELALFLPAIAVGILSSLDDRLLGDAIDLASYNFV